MNKIIRSFLMFYFATRKDVISSANIFECKCYRDMFGREAHEGCYGHNSMANSTFTMTTANCSIAITPKAPDFFSNFSLTVDIGLECDSTGLPMQFCESAVCKASYSDIHTDFPIFFYFPFPYEVHQKGLLILSMNSTDRTAIQTNHENKLNISCKTIGMLLLEKGLLVQFRAMPITGSMSTGSTQKMMPNDLNPSSAMMSTRPVETTRFESENNSYSKKTTQIVNKTSHTVAPNGKQYTSITAASVVHSAWSETLQLPMTSMASLSASDTTLQTGSPLPSFLDDPVNMAAVSVMGGVAVLCIVGVGISSVVLKLGRPKLISPRNTDDGEGESK